MYVHVVKKGENIHGIARAVGADPDEVLAVNGLASDRLLPGSTLLIPTQVPTSLVTYTVKEGDTLRKIANRFHVPDKILLAANQPLPAEGMPVGRVLTLPVPVFDKRSIEVNMRFEVQGEPEEEQTIEEARDSISGISVATGWIEPDGGIELPPVADRHVLSKMSGVGQMLLLLAPLDETAARNVLCQGRARNAFFRDLRLLISHDEFAGVHLEMTSLPPELRMQFNGFVRELAVRVHHGGGRLYVAVRPHHEDDPDHPKFGAYDLPWIARYADRVVWNVEEGYGRADGPPMALAPLHLVRRSLDYALRVMPAQRLLLGMPFYGFDWAVPFHPDVLSNLIVHGPASFEEEEAELIEPPQQVLWDDRAMTPMFVYRDADGERREVWYEDIRSIAAKLHLVREHGLAGISCQVLGSSMIAPWALLRDLFDL